MPFKDPEARKAYNRAYREANRDRLALSRQAHYEANREVINSKNRLYWANNRAKMAETSKAYREANAVELSAKKREARLASLEERRARDRALYQRDRDKMLARAAAYRKANPEVGRVNASRRRAQLEAGDLTTAEWLEILEEFDGRCAYCSSPDRIELEHMTPLSRGGQHTKNNVVPACFTCNRRKGARSMFEFLSL